MSGFLQTKNFRIFPSPYGIRTYGEKYFQYVKRSEEAFLTFWKSCLKKQIFRITFTASRDIDFSGFGEGEAPAEPVIRQASQFPVPRLDRSLALPWVCICPAISPTVCPSRTIEKHLARQGGTSKRDGFRNIDLNSKNNTH
jgi:hypothetical protein